MKRALETQWGLLVWSPAFAMDFIDRTGMGSLPFSRASVNSFNVSLVLQELQNCRVRG